MVRRSSNSIQLARARFRCSVRFGVPPGGLGAGINDLHAFLIARLGRDAYAIDEVRWTGALQAAAVLFDDASAAGEVAAWLDERWPSRGTPDSAGPT
jgi:hypothetical protein